MFQLLVDVPQESPLAREGTVLSCSPACWTPLLSCRTRWCVGEGSVPCSAAVPVSRAELLLLQSSACSMSCLRVQWPWARAVLQWLCLRCCCCCLGILPLPECIRTSGGEGQRGDKDWWQWLGEWLIECLWSRTAQQILPTPARGEGSAAAEVSSSSCSGGLQHHLFSPLLLFCWGFMLLCSPCQ